jgi:uncharacterized protein (TIGR02284 family)
MTDTDAIDVLNDLIETCKDGEYGFRICAEHARTPLLKTALERRAESCRTAATDLQVHAFRLGGTPETGGSAIGAVQRGWVAVRTALSTFDDLAILKECERGESAALERYRDALKNELPPALRALIAEQCKGVQQNQAQISTLRDTLTVV